MLRIFYVQFISFILRLTPQEAYTVLLSCLNHKGRLGKKCVRPRVTQASFYSGVGI